MCTVDVIFLSGHMSQGLLLLFSCVHLCVCYHTEVALLRFCFFIRPGNGSARGCLARHPRPLWRQPLHSATDAGTSGDGCPWWNAIWPAAWLWLPIPSCRGRRRPRSSLPWCCCSPRCAWPAAWLWGSCSCICTIWHRFTRRRCGPAGCACGKGWGQSFPTARRESAAAFEACESGGAGPTPAARS